MDEQMERHELTTPPRAEIVRSLRQGDVPATALTEAYLRRIDELDGLVGAYITVTADTALAEAAARDEALARGEEPGPLHGLPVALKDNIDTAGVRTTCGSNFFTDHVPDEDAEVARRLRDAGVVLLGKTALHEFAYGATTQNVHHGNCRNPWDLSRIPGGSSGGSGAALGAELCAGALGTDTGGSVRIPAALNGATGIRPTIGRVSNRGVFPVSWTFDTVGPMARSIEDVAAILQVLAGFDPGDPVSVDYPSEDFEQALRGEVDGLRIGIPTNFFFDDVDPEVEAAVLRVADHFAELGAAVDEIEIPGAAESVTVTTRMIWSDALAVHRERLETEPERFGEDVRRRLPLGFDVSGADYAAHRQYGREWTRQVEQLFEDVDIVLSPLSAIVAPEAEGAEMIETTVRLTVFTYGWSLAGIPALALPCGFSSDGLPISAQLAAARWSESTLVRAGAAFQRDTDWHLGTAPLTAQD